MNLLDLYEQREPYQQAIDKLEQSRIDTLNDRMQELVARARTADAKTKASLKQQYEKIKNERDSYYKISEAGIPGEKDYAYHRAKERQHELAGDKLMAKAKSFGAHAHPTGIAARKKAEQHYAKADEHRAAWKELGSKPLKEGSMKRWLWSEAERLEKEDFIANADDYGMSEQEAAEFWDSINGAFDEAGIPGNVPTEKIPGKEELLKGRGRTYYEADQVNEYFVRSGDDIMSVMSLNLFKDLLGDASLSNHDEEFADSPEWQAVVDKWQPKAEHLQKELAKYQSAGRKLRDAEADAIDATVYDGGDAYEDAETAASFLPKVYAKQASAVVRLLKDGYANPPADMHEDDSRIVSQNPAPTPLTPKQELEDRARQVRRKKQDLLKRFANGGVIVEIEWALEHNVFMTKEQMLDYLDHTIEDPDLEPIEYMHDKGFTSDSMVKGLFKRLVGLGLSKSQILGIIKNGDQGKPASPSLISRIAGQVLRSEVSENQAFVPAVGDEIMWRPKNAKMAPTPVTVVATTTDKLKIKLQSPRMIQNAGKDTVVVSIKDSDIFPKPVTEQQSQRPPAKGLLKGKDLITPQQRMAGATPQKPGMTGAVKDVAKGLKNFLQGRPETGPTYEAQKKNSEKVDEYISYGSDKNYEEAEPYKNYKIYVRRKPFGTTGMYTAHTEIDRKEFMGKGSSQEEAIAAVRDRIDFVLNAQRKVTGSSTIDFNVKFATDLLADPRQTFYAKLENINGEPKLIIAGPDIASDPELLAAGDFKRSALRNQVDDEGRATPLPGIPLTAKGLRSGDWIANGRYTIGKETTDRDGNRVFDLTYHSTAHTKSDKLRLNQPAFTLGTAREVDEHGGGIGPKQRWQDLMPEQNNPEDYDDADEFGMPGSEFFSDDDRLRDGDYVRDRQDGKYGEIFRMSGDPSERRVRILDRDGRGWYISPERLEPVDRTDPDIMKYFGKRRQRDMDEGWSDAVVARRTGRPRTPYSVYIKGKKWKDFENDDHAEAVANKLRAKFKADGRDPETITIAPTDIDEGIKKSAAATALAACIATGGTLSGCATNPSVGGAIGTVRDVGTAVKTAQNMTRAGVQDELSQELRNFIRAQGGDPGSQNLSLLYKLQKRMQGKQDQPRAINEIKDTEAVEQAIFNRIMVAHKDMLMKYGPEKIMTAASDVAYDVGDIGEIGSSDVSGWVNQVQYILGAKP